MKSPLAARFSRRSRHVRALTTSTAVLLPALTFSGLLATPSAKAANKYYDTATTANLQGGAGTFDLGLTAVWSTVTTGSNPLVTFASGDDGFFQTGVANTVSLSGTVIANSLTQTINSTATTITGGTNLQINAGGLTNTGNAAFTINSALTLGASQNWNASSNTLVIGGTVTVDNSATTGTTTTLTFTGTNTTTSTLSGIVSNNATDATKKLAISQTGTGATTLTGLNTYSGGTTITAGALTASNAAATNQFLALGTGTVTLNGGTLKLRANGSANNQSIVTGNGTTGNNVVVSANSVIDTDNAGTNFTGSAFVFNTLSIGANTLTVTPNNNGYNVQFAGTTTLTGTPTFNVAGGLTTTLTGAISDGGSNFGITKIGSSTLRLSGANTYTGATTVNAGTLIADTTSVATVFSPSSALVLGGGTFQLRGLSGAARTQTLNGLTVNGGSSVVDVNNVGTSTMLDLRGTSGLLGITRSAGAGAVDFRASTGGPLNSSTAVIKSAQPNNANGILGLWATANSGADLARNDGSNNIVAFTGYADVTRLSSGTKTIVSNPASIVRITEGTGSAASITPAAAGTTDINILFQSTSGGSTAATYDPGTTDILRFGASGGISIAIGSGALTLGTTSGDGDLTAGGAADTAGDIAISNNSSNSLTLNSRLTDNGSGVVSLTTTSASTGSIILTAANTYTGATTINLGNFQLGNGGTTGSLSTVSTISTGSGSTLIINRSNAVVQGTDFSSAGITGAGGFTQAGTGITTLNAANTYTGVTTISAGILRLGGGNAIADTGAVTGSTGALLDLNGTSETIGSLTGGDSVTLSAGTLTVGGDGVGSGTLTGFIYGSGGLAKNGTGTLTLNLTGGSSNSATTGSLFSGGINHTAGTLTISGVNASGTGLITAASTFNVSAAQLFWTGGLTISGGTTTLSATNAGGGPGFGGTGINGVGSIGSAGTITLNAGTLALNNTQAAQYNTVALNGGSITTNQTSLTLGALSGTVGLSIATSGTLTLGTNNLGTALAPNTYSGNITVTGGTATNIVKLGSGVQVLNGTNNTTGTITVNGQFGVNGTGGTLELGGQYAAATSVVVNAGTLRLNFGTLNTVTANLINSAAPLTLGGGTLAVIGQTGATNVSQTFASTAFTAGSASNVSVANGGGSTVLNLGGLTRGAGSAVNFILPSGSQSTNNGITTSTGGTSNLLRASNVAYATVGGTDFAAKDSGTNIVALTGSVNAMATSLGASGDDSNINTQDTTVGPGTINTIRFNDSAARTLTLTGALNVNSGGLLVSSAVTTAGSKITGGSITTGTTGADFVVHQFSNQPFTLDTAIVNNGSTGINLTKSGPGTLILTQANTTSGTTYVDSGILRIGSGGSLANSNIILSPNDTSAVFDVNNQTTSAQRLNGGGSNGAVSVGGYVNLGASGNLTLNNSTGSAGTLGGQIVGGVDSVITKTGTTAQSFQSSSQIAFNGTYNLNGGSLGINNGSVNFQNTNFAVGASGIFAPNVFQANVGNFSGSGAINSTATASQLYTYGYNGGAATFSGIISNGTNTTGLNISKFGSGTSTLSGANTYTGTTTLYSGTQVFDFATNDPLSTGPLVMGGATASFKAGATTSDTTGTFSVNSSLPSLSQVAPTNGFTLTLATTSLGSPAIAVLPNNSNVNTVIFDISGTGTNVIRTNNVIGAADTNGTTAIRLQNGLLATGATSLSSYRADVLARDSGGIGFATQSGNSIVRYSGGVAFNATTVMSFATNYKINSDVARTGANALAYNTIELDSSSSLTPVTLTSSTTSGRFGDSSGTVVAGRALLITGTNGAMVTGTDITNQILYVDNYQTGTTSGQTFTLDIVAGNGLVLNGTGLTVATKLVDGAITIGSGVFRPTFAGVYGDALTGGASLLRIAGGVLEIGADLTGSNSATSVADFSRALGSTAIGQVQLIGNSGFSAFGATRTVNLGGAASPTTVTWGVDNFLVSPAGTSTDGNQNFRLSSTFSDATLDFQNPINLNASVRTVDVADGSAAVDARLSGVISNYNIVNNTQGGLTKAGAGTLELTGLNTYNGPTNINAGTLSTGGTNIPDISAVVLANTVGATLNVTGSETIGSLAGGGATGGNVTLGTSTTLTTGGNNNSTTFAGAISGMNASLVKNGTGTFTLTGTNTYTGSTTVNAGALLVNGSTDVASVVTVSNVGTILGGTGTIGGVVTVNATGGTITGAGVGTVGTLTLADNVNFIGGTGTLATYLVDILGATSDRLAVGGVLNLSSLNDQISFSGTPDNSSTYILATFASNSLTGTFDTVTGLPAGYSLVYGLNDIELIPVPEPGTVVAGLLAFGTLGLSQRRRVRGWLGAVRGTKKAA